MKYYISISILILLVMCTKPHQPIEISKQNTSSMDHTAKNNPYYSKTDRTKLDLPDSEWKKVLSPDLYAVARHAGTERPFTGKYNDFDQLGDYHCAACGNHLFRSDAKFASTCGWPSFFEADNEGVYYKRDVSHGMERIEVLCQRCESHLGHVFNDGPEPTGMRYCMNSVSLEFVPDAEK